METDYQVGIVGAGFAGLVAALRLKSSGRDSFVIFERAAELGGTWRDNTYPGCACDVASPLYSFRQELNPNWSQLFVGQAEILAYLKDVVAKNKLEPHICYNTDIVRAGFEEEQGRWKVTTANGSQYTVKLLILGTGPLNRPFIPTFSGMETFGGKVFHSSQWDHSYNLTGKRVAVIGTGASAIQIIPAIAPLVDHLTVFQRTPAWVARRRDRSISEVARNRFRRFPFLMKLQREAIYWFNEFVGLGFIGHDVVNRIMRQTALRRLKRQVNDPETRRKLTPAYKIGCKRILTSNDYYPVFNRNNVKLVTEPIERFTPEGILAGGVVHPLDAVILGTGFIAADIELYLQVIGLKGENLMARWKTTGAEAYLGTTITGFPNLCFILGPNTGLGSNSVVHIMESQMNYVMHYLSQLEKLGDGGYLDVKAEVQKQFNHELQQKFNGTVWASGCRSWYLNAAGKNTTLYPRLSADFRRKTKRFNPAVYHRVTSSASEDRPVKTATTTTS